ncbi:uncharacterized protein GGS25DRAFT_528503 [Hypoxylon fragiforme]|uniref:uncharacterized protein n=1 Tax=Hypoxylon fragiforme TaxID=63214 RepID=UPI0020C6B2BA|nr:uncharacterized protein GGS25DRAFT_528503 [Hypoxylon fragiforme]KAI2603457.1 hypothetical protein GGS25DRAFT_528503 [Hypoxylon fragiforme]
MSTPPNRPTPQSLPRLTIPASRYKVSPEEITTRRADAFLAFCQKHGRAPITRLPTPNPRRAPISDPNSKTSPLSSLEEEEDEEEGTSSNNNNGKSSNSNSPNDNEDEDDYDSDSPTPTPPPTLAFTEREDATIESTLASYNAIKEQHTRWIEELQANPRDRAALAQCRHWRQLRERLDLELRAIWDRREIRRRFRADVNNVDGLVNW